MFKGNGACGIINTHKKKKKNTLKGKTSPPAGQLREMQERVPVPQ